MIEPSPLHSTSAARTCPSQSCRRKRIPFVAIDYRTGSSGANAHPRLLGMSCQLPGRNPQQIPATANTDNLAQALHGFSGRRRVYASALQARLLEQQHCLPPADRFDDVSIMARLLDGDWPDDLCELAATLLDEPPDRKNRQSVEAVLDLCSKAQLRRRVHNEGLDIVYQLELDVIDPSVAMMRNGVRVDADCLSRLAAHFAQRAQDSQGKPARQYAALRDTAQRLLRHVDTSTGRIHCSLNPLGTPTGRFTCNNPALQAVPPELKKAFIAEPGHVLLEADFSQMELRVLAHFSREPAFMAAFSGDNREVDIHGRTAALALGIAEDDVTADQRNTVGKGINFGIIYGLTAHGLAQQLSIDVEQAEQFSAAYFAAYPAIRRWKQAVEQQVSGDLQVRTLYGRRRYLPLVRSTNKATKQQALRQAVNTIIQGTAADINKLALVRLHRALPDCCRLLLTVHDSVLLEVPEDRAESASTLLRRVMQSPPPEFTVPLAVTVGCGRCWAECQ